MSPRPHPFVPKVNHAEEGTLKGQLIKLGMYTIAASFEVGRTCRQGRDAVCRIPRPADRTGDGR